MRRRSLALGVGAIILVAIIAAVFVFARQGGAKPPVRSTALPSANASSSQSEPPAASSADAPPPPSPTLAQAGQLCSDDVLAVVVSADKATYNVGEQPKFKGVVTNGSALPCQRDVGDGMQAFIVSTLDGSDRVWSSQDCAPTNGQSLQMLKPGQQVAFQATWTGKTSSPGCQEERVDIQPGYYRVVAQLGQKVSAPATFNVVAP
ncbi:conserved hypothetical protein [Segniliparus rotundus DSM 44985]|uniref:Intracellular proteinase inhibitor BsuPI domain-containing protein n=1 Tax=Segniliparus rotundus (strain ATCC BAA-972 / CDC 1076 / CIP 108378 / DSM 44985 / JCM 13578) TaxID=640132 RepID=D6ZBV2_SEGRD|nr:conserved hypothetical protein [Segniliparus rotundus DSM 44985]